MSRFKFIKLLPAIFKVLEKGFVRDKIKFIAAEIDIFRFVRLF